MPWVVVVVGVLALIAFGALTSAQLRRGGTPPGPEMPREPASGHDEPLEDMAQAVDRPRHHDGRSPAEVARDAERMLGH